MIIAPHRGDRPNAFLTPSAAAKDASSCPFCRGNEEETPPEIERVSGDDGGWIARVVPNKYPAVGVTPILRGSGPEFFAAGTHEVLIESALHDPSAHLYSASQLVRTLEAYQRRYEAAVRSGDVRSITIFKNSGKEAGASIVHPHSQLLATAFVAGRLAAMSETFRDSMGCPLCALEMMEDHAERIVAENEDAVLLAPFASRFAYETWIVPRRHKPSFRRSDGDELRGIAQLLHRSLTAVEQRFPAAAFNWILIQSPLEEGEESESFHWYIEITPRLTHLAGFETGSGAFINNVAPETAAAELREATRGKRPAE